MRWVRRRRSTLVRATRYHEKRNTETNRQRPCLLIAANASSPAKTLRFAGYDWVAKSATHEGPGPNNWNENNVWVDQGGYLHLKLTKQGDRWYCAEVLTKDRLGFGRYQFWVVGRLDRLDPNVVLGLFNYPTPDVGPDGTNEIDIEFAQWGKPEAPIGNYTVWPAREGLRRASKRFSMELKGEFTTHRFTWHSTSVAFESLHGHHDDNSNKFADWLYQPDDQPAYISQKAMPVRINLWLFQGQPPRNGQQVELIVRSFKFMPL
jgi:hypothetical protein